MSTKAIREALALLRHAETCAGEPTAYVVAADAALSEVEAIEKAAQVLSTYETHDKVSNALSLFATIAKESMP